MHYQRNETTLFFSKYKIFFRTFTDKKKYIDKPTYFIDQRTGGPHIDFSFYHGYSDDAVIHL
jgi:hypothetical protein